MSDEELNKLTDDGQQSTGVPELPDVDGELALPEGSEEVTIVQEETITKNLNPDSYREQTRVMEVHHHPDLHHRPKKWKEYFLEFLMIFLAVTMGFFAESYREHLIDNKREKEIISALYNDLKKDTANLNDIIYRYMPGHSAWEDSAEAYVLSLPIKENQKKIALAFVNATNWNFYSPPQVSLEILKSSGTFNLIGEENIKEGIINFNSLVNTYLTYSQFILAAEHAMDTATAGIIRKQAMRLLIASVYLKTNAKYGSIDESDLPPGDLLKTYDPKVYTDYINKLDAMDYLLHDLLGLYQKIFKEETILLDALKKEYHLE